MPVKDLNKIQKIELLVSFLDEDNAEILKNVEHELLLLNEDENVILRQILIDIENPIIANRLKNIVIHNNFRFWESTLLLWLKDPERKLFDLLAIISGIEYPNLDYKSLKSRFDKLLKEVWTAFSPEISALDVVKILKSAIFDVYKFKAILYESTTIKHFMINDVLANKETNNLFLNIFYLSLTRALQIPVVPLKINGNIMLGFENKSPYNISFLDNDFLFFIDNYLLEPYPEEALRKNFKIDIDTKLTYTSFTDTEIALMLLNWLSGLYEKDSKVLQSESIKEIIKLIEKM